MSGSLKPLLEGYSHHSFEGCHPFVYVLTCYRQPRLTMFKVELLILTSPVLACPSHGFPMWVMGTSSSRQLLRLRAFSHSSSSSITKSSSLTAHSEADHFSPMPPSWFNAPSPLSYIVPSVCPLSPPQSCHFCMYQAN